MDRRRFLKRAAGAAAAAPLGAQMAAQQAGLQAVGVSTFGAAVSEGADAPEGPEPVKFTNFAKWLGEFGREALRKEAQEVRSLDEDLVVMASLPLTTKMRIQRERNYERLLEGRKDWFARRMERQGEVSWWP